VSYRQYALERVGSALAILWLAVTGTYLMFHVALGAPPISDPSNLNGEFQARAEEFADESYGGFLTRLLVDRSLGINFVDGSEVNDRAAEAVPPTTSLLLFTFAFATVLAVPLGVFWGRRRPGRLTRPLKALSAVLYGASMYTIGLLLIYWVGFKWGLLPLGSYCDLVNPQTECGGLVDWSRALILPGISLSLFFGAIYLRLVSALVRNAERARKEGDELARRRAALSYVKLLGRDFGFGLGLTIFVEAVFGIPGIGRMFLSGYARFDAALMEGVLILSTLIATGVNLAVDLAVAADRSFRRF
jgi:peptide/nickel transport system permease protein